MKTGEGSKNLQELDDICQEEWKKIIEDERNNLLKNDKILQGYRFKSLHNWLLSNRVNNFALIKIFVIWIFRLYLNILQAAMYSE